METKKNYICVSGYSASGSSAVVDLLKEFDNVFECSAEIRIIQDPYGIRQLERALTDDWNEISSSAAINDFLWLCKKCAKKGGGKNPFAPCGLSYSRKICSGFYSLSLRFIEKISDYKYKSDYYCQKFKKNYFRYVFDRIRLGLELKSKRKLRIANRRTGLCYFSHPTHDFFENAVREYFDSIFSSAFDKGANYIVLDQAISVNDPDAVSRYFNNGKLIIVDRDPRDMFIDDIVNWGNVFENLSSKEAGERFVIRHKAMRSSISNSKNILYIKFEDLVLKYDETVLAVLEFLEMDNHAHVKKGAFFKPQVSKNNIGIWRKYYNEFKDAIDYITKELQSYCFEA